MKYNQINIGKTNKIPCSLWIFAFNTDFYPL
ncbi:hypothetical protein NCPPB2254_05430 [Pseudomonas syringae pv. persicae]|uniref:Uncharacterized protein n=1 Tax=Pseudomonas syringae pv. persicae TaxID=237306 RepID=A0AB38ELS1_9PSED|nr:hypothetical protein NCPPB2254_05430 [Pseudomonas syringae pv. persicae]